VVAGPDPLDEPLAHEAAQVPQRGRALTSARTRTFAPVASVICSTHTRPSHSSLALTTRCTSSRISATGRVQSTSTSTVPRTAESLRVQFSNGLLAKYDVGSTSRRSSQMRTMTYVRVISST
jgi:hypothetical protein